MFDISLLYHSLNKQSINDIFSSKLHQKFINYDSFCIKFWLNCNFFYKEKNQLINVLKLISSLSFISTEQTFLC